MRPFRAIALTLVLATGSGCVAADSGALSLRRCTASGVSARCGSLDVPEDRAAPDGTRISLNVVILPARARTPASDPVIFLQGGPGGGATDLVPLLAGSALRRTRDIVLVDQRGTGRSNPLRCDGGDLTTKLDVEGSFFYAQARDCLGALGVDPRHYTTADAIADLEDVRRALGVDRVNLLGGSYGTRVALDYMRRHPTSVRTATLRGVAPPPFSVPATFDRDSMDALDDVLDGCLEDRRCRRAFPDLRDELSAVVARLTETPATATVRANGERTRIRVDRSRFATALHHALYSIETAAHVPRWIHDAHAGELDELMTMSARFTLGIDAIIAAGAFLSVACAEDVPFYDPDQVVRAARGTLLGGAMSEGLARACELWPTDPAPAAFKEPVRSDVPTLLISGEADPVTPPRHAEDALRHLPNGLHLVLPDHAHIELAPGCVEALMVEFVDSGSVTGLETGCTRRLAPRRYSVD